MNPVPLNQLAKTIHGNITDADDKLRITGVSIDSRTIQPGQVFFAIRGENFDGHSYISAAIENGACCAVVERDITLPDSCKAPVIKVDSTVTALGQLASWFRGQLPAKVIAVTGSVGKTTTRHILHQILSRHFKCRQARNSFNNHIGVPLTLLSAEADDEVLLVELGSNSPGEIEYLTTMTCPDMALISRVAPAHLEGFGSIENIIKEKSSIALGLSVEGTLFINGDQPELVEYVHSVYDRDVVTVGTSKNCDVTATDFRMAGHKGSLVIEGRMVSVPLAGRANLSNVLMAWAVCREFISLSDFIDAVESLQPNERRLVPVRIGSLLVLDDCYNANPASMDNALYCLKSIAKESSRRAVFVAGCMAELGHQSAALHEKLGRNTVSSDVKLLLASGPFSEEIVRGAKKIEKYPIESQAYENTDKLCDNLHKWIQPDDIILVKGSRSAQLEKAVERLKELFEE